MSELRGMSTGVQALLVGLALALSVPQGAAAQEGDVWLPLIGCWQPEGEPADAPMTCVRPAAEGGVTLLTVADDGVIERRHLRADGVQRAVAQGECTGVERAELSRDGLRVFVDAELACAGEPARTTRGLITMVDERRWIEAQAMDMRGRSVAWVTRYEPAPRARIEAAGRGDILAMMEARGALIRAARLAATAPVTVDDIIEAHARTDSEVVRVWLAEQLTPMELDADGLRRLAAAGVSDEVIDVAVALAYPERFAVTREDPYAARDRRPRTRPGVYPGYPGYPYPGYWGPGYGYWGWGSWRYHRPTVVVVAPRDGSRGIARAVRGRGYTRGTPSSTGTAATGSDRPTSSQPAASSGGSRSSGGERRAQPRQNNND
jgi:hypothetical protein